jgi:transcriptional regulator with XRE-family HTH domain
MALRGGDRGEARRQALQRAMDERGMKPADVARAAGLPSANAIYNFLNRRSKSLAAETLERIARALPETSVEELTGLNTGPRRDANAVLLRAVARAGVWLPRFDLPHAEQTEIPLPVTRELAIAGAFAVRVEPPGAELRWGSGAIQLCIPPGTMERPLTHGSWVVLERARDGKVEITARQVEVENGKAWLWLRTKDPRFPPAVPMAWPCDGARAWRHDGEQLRIAGIVVGVWEPL